MYAVVDGHCRFEVAKKANLDYIWALFTENPEAMMPASQDTNKLTPAQVFNCWARHPKEEQDAYLKGLRKGNLSSGYIRDIEEHLGWGKAVEYGHKGVKPSYISTARKLHFNGKGLFIQRVPSIGSIFEWLVSSKSRGTKGAEIANMKGNRKKEHQKLFTAVRLGRDFAQR
jgi:hypothetical protein